MPDPKSRSGVPPVSPSRGELDRGRRALEIVEKQLDLGERAGKLLRTDAVKAEWSSFLRTLNAELKRLPSVAAAAVAVDLKLDANRVEDIQAAVARCIEAMRERLLDVQGEDDEGGDDGLAKE